MNREKSIFTLVIASLSAWIGILAIPVLILVILNITDYITGMIASTYRQEKISSYRSFRGIAKKVCMWLLVIIGGLIDWLLWFAADSVGIITKIYFTVSCIVAIWLICNELLSILENISDIGVSLPPFLIPLVSKIKSHSENKVETEFIYEAVDEEESDGT